MNANPTITYYRMRTDGIYDPTTDEKITENSTFTYAGDYYSYAVVGETDNYAELFTERTKLTVNPSGNHTHCLYGHKGCEDYPLTYDGFNGSSLSPDGSKDLSYYLNAARSNVDLMPVSYTHLAVYRMVGYHGFFCVISDESVQGIRFRKGNILVGNGTTFANFFPSEGHNANRMFAGEILSLIHI